MATSSFRRMFSKIVSGLAIFLLIGVLGAWGATMVGWKEMIDNYRNPKTKRRHTELGATSSPGRPDRNSSQYVDIIRRARQAQVAGRLDEARLQLERVRGIEDVLGSLPMWEWQYIVNHLQREASAAMTYVSPLSSVAYSPDGKVAVVRAGQELFVYANDIQLNREAAWTQAGKWRSAVWLDEQTVIAGDEQGRVVFLRNGRPPVVCGQHATAIFRLCVHPTAGFLSCSIDGEVRRWNRAGDLQDRKRLAGAACLSLAWSPTGAVWVVGDDQGSIHQWSVGSDEEEIAKKIHKGPITALAGITDGWLTAGVDGNCRQWPSDWSETTLERELPEGWISSLVVIPNSNRFVTAGQDELIRVWSLTSVEPIREFKGHRAWIVDLDACPQTRRFTSVDGAGKASVWDPREGLEAEILTFEPSQPGAVDPQGRWLVQQTEANQVRWTEVVTGEPRAAWPWDGTRLTGVGWDVDGVERVVLLDETGAIVVRDLSQQDQPIVQRWRTLPGAVDWQIFNGRMFVRTASGLEVVDLDTGERQRVDGDASQVKAARLHRLLDAVAVLDDAGNVRVQSVNPALPMTVTLTHPSPVTDVVWHPEAAYLATIAADNVLRTWKLQHVTDGAELAEPSRSFEVEGQAGLGWTADAMRFAVASEDGSIKLYSAATTMQLITLQGPEAPRHISWDVDNEIMTVRSDDAHYMWRGNLRGWEGRLPALELNNAAWERVRYNNQNEMNLRVARRFAEEALRQAPRNDIIVNTYGVALYRLRQYEAALKNLKQAAVNSLKGWGTLQPWDLAFIAMAQHQLGNAREASEAMRQLREVMDDTRLRSREGNEQAWQMFEEAEATLSQPAPTAAKRARRPLAPWPTEPTPSP